MRFKISAPQAREPLSVLPTLPSDRLGLLEGQNGVGKTLAIKTLQLCTGDISLWQSDPDLWRSYCRLLGPLEVEISDLLGDGGPSADRHTLRWRIDLASRASEVPERLSEKDFELVELDGQPTTMAVVQQLLEIERVDGSENMPQTLRRLISEETRTAQRAEERLRWAAGEIERRFATWLAAYRVEDAQTLLAATEEASAAEAATKVANETLRRREERATQLANAREAIRLINEVKGDTAQALLAQKQELSNEVDSLAASEREAAARLASVSAAREQQTALSKELDKAERLFERRLGILATRSQRADAAGAELGVDGPAAVSAELAKLEDQLTQLAEERAAAERAQGVAPITQQLRDVLTGAREHELGDRTVAILPDRQLTAMQLLAAVDRRRAELGGPEKDAQIEAIAARIADLEGRRTKLLQAARLYELVENARRNLSESEQEIAAMKARTDPDTAERQQAELTEALGQARSALTEKQVQLALVESHIDRLGAGRSIVDLEHDRDRNLALADATPTDAAALSEELAAEIAQVRDELRHLEQRRAELAETIDGATRRLRDLVQHPASGPGALTLSSSSTVRDAARAVVELGERATAENERNRELTQSVALVAVALSTLTDRLHEQPVRPPTEEVRSAFERVAKRWERRLLDIFGTPALSSAVFDGGTLTRVNLEERQFEWKVEGDPTVRRRPFSGFSSGERAFAYTQARIAELGVRSAANKLLAVDEFGAYLSAERRERLAAVIRDAVLGGKITQAMLVLPLRVDLSVPDAVLPPGVHQNLDQVKRQRWLTAPLSAGEDG